MTSEYAVPNPGVVVPTAKTSHVASSSKAIKPQDYDFRITTSPKKVKKVTSVEVGPVGVMMSGALLYNPYEGDGTTVAMASNFTIKDSKGKDVPFVDPCSGHPAPSPVNAYHYHGLPKCVKRQVDKKKGPSHIIGVAFDGFPIYGNRDIHGKVIKPWQLDRCNGIKSRTPEFHKGNGIYHYVLPKTTTAKSSMSCFHGRVKNLQSDVSPLVAGQVGLFCVVPKSSSPGHSRTRHRNNRS